MPSSIHTTGQAGGRTLGAESSEALAALRRFTRSRPPVERCELCGSALNSDHPHLLDHQSRQVACSCDACAILFCGQEGAKFLRVPRRVLKLIDFTFADLAWEAMMLPINMAFFVRSPEGATSVFYPSPAGAMSSLLDVPGWDELFAGERRLLSVEPEVEGLLVNRISDQAVYFIAPLDACYRLVGLIRTKWRGLSGGPDVWRAVAEFFADLDRQATPVRGESHA